MSIKQLLLDMSTEARAEIRKFLDELESVEATIVPAVEAKVEQVEDAQTSAE